MFHQLSVCFARAGVFDGVPAQCGNHEARLATRQFDWPVGIQYTYPCQPTNDITENLYHWRFLINAPQYEGQKTGFT
jgi:hypothetical protein